MTLSVEFATSPKEEKETFPCLRTAKNGAVLLVTRRSGLSYVGTIVRGDSMSVNTLGEYSELWAVSCWKPFVGYVKLSEA